MSPGIINPSPLIRTNSRLRRQVLEYGLLATGLVFLALFAHSYFKFENFQHQNQLSPNAAEKGLSRLSSTARSMKHPIGEIRVRRLGLAVSFVEGDDEDSLALAAGHMPGSAMAGQSGNMIVAGHRDTAFWPIRHLRVGDRIEVVARDKAAYRVERMSIVEPTDLSLLKETNDSVLTLVTCYPFRYIGPAPQRFIVRAKLESAQ